MALAKYPARPRPVPLGKVEVVAAKVHATAKRAAYTLYVADKVAVAASHSLSKISPTDSGPRRLRNQG